MDVMRAANQRVAGGENVLRLEVGEPGTPAPQAVLDAAQKGNRGRIHRLHRCVGPHELSESGSPSTMEKLTALDLSPDRVIVTTGASGAFVLSFLAAFEAGDRIALASPGLSCVPPYFGSLGERRLSSLEAHAETRYQPSAQMICDQNNLQGSVGCESRQPDRKYVEESMSSRLLLAGLPRRNECPCDIGRDLSRHHLRRTGEYGVGIF